MRGSSLPVVLALVVCIPGMAHAEATVPDGGLKPPFDEVGFDQRLGESLPGNLPFLDEDGHAVHLSDYLGTRPVILSLAYYRCPMLCPLVQTGLGKSLAVVGLKPGDDFTAVTVSIDPRERPEQALAGKTRFLSQTGLTSSASGWHFLTGDADSIERLASAVGFRYAYDKATDQYAHTGGIVVVTPDGRLAQYMLGIDFAPRDLRLALVSASNGRIGTIVDRLTLLCYQYDPATGHYGLVTYRIVRVGGVITVVLLGIFVLLMLLREQRSAREGTA